LRARKRNQVTTIITVLLVFMIQNTRNRGALALHLKFDELIHSVETADNRLIQAEDETDEELVDLKRKYEGALDEHTALKNRLGKPTAPR